MWYVKFSDAEVRRGSLEQLQGLIAKGRITPATLVKSGPEGVWVEAGGVAELFPTCSTKPMPSLAAGDPYSSAAFATASSVTLPLGAPVTKSNAPWPLLIYVGAGAALIVLALVVGVVWAFSGKKETPTLTAIEPTPAPQTAVVASSPTSPILINTWLPVHGSDGKETATIDLIGHLTPEANTHLGTIRKTDGTLFTSGNKPDVARVDVELPTEYTLDMEVCPKSRPESLHVGLVVGGKPTLFIVGGFQGLLTGLFTINGKVMNDPNYPNVYRGPLLTLDKSTKLKICVTPRSVGAWCDNKPVFRWEGRSDELDWKVPYKGPEKPCLLLGSWDCRYEIRRWTITKGVQELPPLESLVRTSAPPAAPPQTSRAPATPSGAEMRLPELAQYVGPSIVRLDVHSPLVQGVGSGFVIEDGVVVTNLHVVKGGKAVRLTFADKSIIDAESLITMDVGRDLAFIRYDSTKHRAPALALAPSLPGVGEAVAAFGAPQGLSFTMTDGIVSALREGKELQAYGADFSARMVQTSAPISPGNSGGPLVDMRGRVVGVNTVQLRGGQNLNFAVSSLDVRNSFAHAHTALQKKEQRGLYVAANKMQTLAQFDKRQKEAMVLPPLIETEWVIDGTKARATMVSLQSLEASPRPPSEFRKSDFSRGKYQSPTNLRARLKGANGKERDIELSALDAAGQQRVRDRWLEEAHFAIKLKLVQQGNNGVRLFVAGVSGHFPDPHGMIRLTNTALLVAGHTLPTTDAEQVRTLVMENFDLLGVEQERDGVQRTLEKAQVALKSSFKDQQQTETWVNGLLQELLVPGTAP